MRYLTILCGVLLAALPACAYNEMVSAISYNPSRMGAYTHLKVAKSATLIGGLELQEDAILYFKSGASSEVEIDDSANNRTCSDSNCEGVNTFTNIKPNGYDQNGQCETGRTCATGLNAPKVLVQKNSASSSSVSSYSYTGTAPSSDNQLDQLIVYGGAMTVGESAYVDSYIDQIPNDNTNGTVEKLKMTAGVIWVEDSHKLFITNSLKLGNITITKGEVSNPQTYAFVERKFCTKTVLGICSESTSAYILAVK